MTRPTRRRFVNIPLVSMAVAYHAIDSSLAFTVPTGLSSTGSTVSMQRRRHRTDIVNVNGGVGVKVKVSRPPVLRDTTSSSSLDLLKTSSFGDSGGIRSACLLGHSINSKVTTRTTPTTTTATTSLSLMPVDKSSLCSLVNSVLVPSSGPIPFALAFGINSFLFAALQSKLLKLLTPSGFGHALFLGTVLWSTLGWKGWSVCVAYFLLGSAVTKIKMKEKEAKGIAEGRGGRRGPENVWGSAASAAVCAVASTQGPSFLGIPSSVYTLGYVTSLATKLADTFASEIGKAYGKHTFLITTLEPVKPGTEGAISAEGSAAAVLGGFLLSLCGTWTGLISVQDMPVCVVAAFVATNVESLIGALFQGKDSFEWMTNEVVNFFNTSIGAMIAIGSKLALMAW